MQSHDLKEITFQISDKEECSLINIKKSLSDIRKYLHLKEEYQFMKLNNKNKLVSISDDLEEEFTL